MTRHPRPALAPPALARLARAAALSVVLAPGLAPAQEPPAPDVPPTITLGAPPADPQDAPVQEAPPAAPPAPRAESGESGDSPMIQLQAAPPPAAAAPLAPPLAIERDRATDPAAGQGDWLLPLTADPALPRQVRIGDSLPAPGILRLTGEVASTSLGLTLPETAPPPAELHLVLRSGVDVLIGAAFLSVSVNGGAPVDLPLRSIGDFAQVTLPAQGLRPGANTLALSLRQPHRIFCGPDASFDVWTEIDLSRSGARLPAGALRPDAEGFALALGAQIAQDGALDLLVEQGIDPALLRRAADAVMAGLGPRGRLRVTSFYDAAPPRHAAVALIAADRPAVSYRMGAGGAIVLQIEMRGDALPDIAAALPAPAPDAIPDAGGPPALQPGRPTTLAELGSADIVGATHYFRRDIGFALPDDWLLLANQKARLTLRYGFARQLAEGAMLLVKVNDQTVRLLPLDRDGGEILPPLPIGFNANLLHPGRNILSFEMMVPGDPPTEACPARTTDMLVVLAESVLDVPASPSMALPGMAGALMGLRPADVTVPPAAAGDTGLQVSAIRLASALGASQQPREGVSLTVARLSELPQLPLEGAGVSQGQLQALLFPRQPAAAEAVALPVPAVPLYRLDLPAAAGADQPGALARLWTGLTGRLFSQERLWRDAEAFRQTAFQGSELSLRDWLAERQGEALLWRPDPEAPGSLWLILGPRVAVDEVADRLEALIAARSAIGEAAVLRADGTWDIWTPIRPPLLGESLAGGNLRAILGNYASWSPLLFTLSLLALALLSALPALIYLRASRGPKGRP